MADDDTEGKSAATSAPPKLLSARAYARHRREHGLAGQSHVAVLKAMREGRLARSVVQKGKRSYIEPEAADIEWEESTKVQMRREQNGVHFQGKPPALVESNSWEALYKARLRNLDYLERVRELLPADETKRAVASMTRNLRDLVLALADSIGPLMAPESDPDKCTRLLRSELEKALQELSNGPGR